MQRKTEERRVKNAEEKNGREHKAENEETC